MRVALGKTVKITIALAVAVLVVCTAVMLCIEACSSDRIDYTPTRQGSHVMEMSYTAVDGPYESALFDSYKAFRRSDIAEIKFIPQKPAREERYSAQYFRTRKLAVIQFNSDWSGEDYLVAAASFGAGTLRVTLAATRNTALCTLTPATYYCFIETEQSVEGRSVELEILPPVEHASENFRYLDGNNVGVLIDEEEPAVYRLESEAALLAFYSADPYLTPISPAVVRIGKLLANGPVLLVRLQATAEDRFAAALDAGTVQVTVFRSDHYATASDELFSVLIVLPASEVPTACQATRYHEYEDGALDGAEKTIDCALAVVEQAGGLTRFRIDD